MYSTTQEALVVKVRKNLAVSELVKLGNYKGFVDLNVNNRRFPEPRGREKVSKLILVRFDIDVTSNEAMEAIRNLGLHLGTVKELLSLSIDHPRKQLKSPIVALGSRCRLLENWRVPCLDRCSGVRRLSLRYLSERWFSSICFLASRK